MFDCVDIIKLLFRHDLDATAQCHNGVTALALAQAMEANNAAGYLIRLQHNPKISS